MLSRAAGARGPGTSTVYTAATTYMMPLLIQGYMHSNIELENKSKSTVYTAATTLCAGSPRAAGDCPQPFSGLKNGFCPRACASEARDLSHSV